MNINVTEFASKNTINVYPCVQAKLNSLKNDMYTYDDYMYVFIRKLLRVYASRAFVK